MDEHDDLYDAAARLVVKDQKPSTLFLQRVLRIGWGRASLLLNIMEQDGLVSPLLLGRRTMLVKADYFVAVDAELARAERPIR